MPRLLVPAILLALTGTFASTGIAQTVIRTEPTSPTLTVSGRGEASAPPDEAVVRLGAVAQAEQASQAQTSVNQILQKALADMRALGVPEQQIRTSGLTLSPVYSQADPRQQQPQYHEPRIIGYRANNTIEVRLQDLSKIGSVIDAGVAAGANQIEGVSFELKQDDEQRKQALQAAVAEARAKAEAIAGAMGVQILSVREIMEGGVDIIRPQPEFKMARAMAADSGGAGAPVQPGQVQISASVTVQYVISGGGGQ